MATKIYIFCNKHSTEYTKELVAKSWTFYSTADGRRSSELKDPEKIDKGLQKERHSEIINVDNYSDYTKLDFVKNTKINPNSYQTADKIFFFITPELFWKTDNIDEGYEYVQDIITNKLQKENHILQFRFLSILPYETLINRCRSSLKRLVESFPYYDLLADQREIIERSFIEYSSTHYKLIKKLAVSDAGYINYLVHEIGNTINSPDSSEQNDRNLLNSINGLNYLNKDIKNICASYTNDCRVDVFQNLKILLNDLLLNYYTDSNNRSYNKYQYKVMIVEDDRLYRNFLKNVLQKFFETVDIIEQDQNEEFSDMLKKNLLTVTEKYDIVFLDLMYKNENGNWADYSGLDLYKTIRARNHYCVTPIITSLPRAVVASLIKEVDENGIPYHLLLSKANGEQFFLLDFKDKFPDIIKTCKDNQKKRTIFQPIPKEGIFKIVPGMILSLVIEKKQEFERFVSASLNFFELYKKNELNVLTPQWNKGNLPSLKMLNLEKLKESYISTMLPIILTHRLIVIDYALNSGNAPIRECDFVEGVLSKISNSRSFNKNYLNSKLGFSVTTEHGEFRIILQNMFPHEYAYMLNFGDQPSGWDVYSQLKEWFVNMLCEIIIYENWDELNLPTPYINTDEIDSKGFISKQNINPDLNINFLKNFLEKLIDNYYENEWITEIFDKVAELWRECSRSFPIPQNIKIFLNDIADNRTNI